MAQTLALQYAQSLDYSSANHTSILSGIEGFANRATHNLHVLLEEAAWIKERFERGTYQVTYKKRLDNTIYAPLIERVAAIRFRGE